MSARLFIVPKETFINARTFHLEAGEEQGKDIKKVGGDPATWLELKIERSRFLKETKEIGYVDINNLIVCITRFLVPLCQSSGNY